jgi:hypothetical protein
VGVVRVRAGHFESPRAAVSRTIYDVHFPSILLLAVAYSYEGTVSMSVSLFAHHVNGGDLRY